MTAPIVPATLAFTAEGFPYSPLFDDVYHSTDGGLGQAAHVFLGGNDLPARWQERTRFTIVETGFGLGLNFLATWAAWRAHVAALPALAAAPQLHFVSVEKHPFTPDDLRRAYQHLSLHPEWAPLAPLIDALCTAWPLPLPGLHRLSLGDGLSLTVAFGDLLEWLPKLRVGADAFYLDGFSPAKNPAMWSPPVFKALARMARTDATVATYTAAGLVRRGLLDAGFEVGKRPGYGRKRDMLAGRFAPRWRVRRHEPPAVAAWPERHALVIGAGLAGCALACNLTANGWRVTLLERRDAPAREASGNPAGVFHPQLSRDDNVLARLTRAGYLHALAHWQALEKHYPLRWSRTGLLQLADDDAASHALPGLLDALGYPPAYVRAVDRQEAARLAGMPVAQGGLWFGQGGWIDPASLCRAQLMAAGDAATLVTGAAVTRLERCDTAWHALDAEGTTLAQAPVAILANAGQAGQLLQPYLARGDLPLKSVRGQLTGLPPGELAALRAVVCGDGYVAPPAAMDGCALTGATYDFDDHDDTVRVADHQRNLDRLAALLPDWAGRERLRHPAHTGDAGPHLDGRVAFRCTTTDRLPVAGAIPDIAAIQAGILANDGAYTGAHLADLPRLPGLFGVFALGSRGLVWASLCAALVTSQLEGNPWPVEAALADAIDPARALLGALRRGRKVV
ncbi:MAG: bifunctional tRNA (5-methylaminomethyl-2-thiouridine)(34)-methyltransferase MnmD/FAD-dependent 5-carboxymethylaminomethyl-2-thiouridine(34) oxidoreductase MnmC [Burkholderiales bacterium]|nr:bifunctional tRNA (5-methylaminomethyl-2-thiouridine)(34)-methyltransferase MnmD/FAD-dependent 5-carboxymethylaminomethyl-2-thiouridine(34) oxidoreductase MnmC [Burkholderiales bacterium]